MAKRRLNKRQKERIEAIRERRLRQAEAREERTARSVLDGAEPDGALRDGLVITNFGANQWVEDLGAPLLAPPVRRCVCRQNLGDVVCGDRVLWQPVGAEQGVISAVKPRSTTLARLNAAGD
ncbi:MAG: ribosome small subunit-dependent GTPase, partial [Gammaproteobacteria bacterium]